MLAGMTTPRFLFCSVALAALVTCLPVSVAHAQYIGYRSDQPNVEIDLSALDDTPTTSPVQPKQQPRTEDFPPPITSGNTAGNQPPAVPVPRVEAAPKRLAKPLFAVPINTPAPPPPKPVATPQPVVTPPAPVQQQRQQRPPAQNIIWDQPAAQKPVVQPKNPAPVPAARKPYNPYLSVPPAAKPAPAPQVAPQRPSIDAALQPDARQKMPLPVMVNTPFDVESLTALPRRKPEIEAAPAPQITEQKAPPVTATPVEVAAPAPAMAETLPAPTQPAQAALPAQNTTPQNQMPRTAGTQQAPVPTAPASTMSYPPNRVQKAPVQYYDRPVLPTATVETSVKPALPAVPVALPEEHVTLDTTTPVTPPVRKPAMAAPAVPEKNIATHTSVPARKPLQPAAVETLMPDETIPLPEVAATETEAPIATPKKIVPVVRPSFVTTSAPPPEMRQDAEPQAIFGYPADVQQPPVPFEQIAENMETVPVEVAIAPPKPEYGARVVPSKADLTLEFKGHSEELDTQSQNKLLNIVKILSEDSDRKLLVRGYASGENGSKTDALDKSLTRVSEVRSFLMEQGVRPTRVMVRALGQETDRKPLDRVDLVFAQQ
jgi:outer membrane protein OmpA-like peptidoglycan-associated protein